MLYQPFVKVDGIHQERHHTQNKMIFVPLGNAYHLCFPPPTTICKHTDSLSECSLVHLALNDLVLSSIIYLFATFISLFSFQSGSQR